MASEEYKRLGIRVLMAILRAVWRWLVYSREGREELKAQDELRRDPGRDQE